jgi:Transposase IS116/IS110/IS902 family
MKIEGAACPPSLKHISPRRAGEDEEHAESTTALVASVSDPKAFRSGRDFSAWIGLVPNRDRAAAKISSATSASQAIAIYAAYSPPVLSL